MLVLPGLMGSRLGRRGAHVDQVIWLNLHAVVSGRLASLALPRGRGLESLGAMWLNVLKLKLSLQVAGFDAGFHAYDWRLSLAELARELEVRIAAEPDRRFMLVGHSMGGMVARAALAGPSARRIVRVVQLGAPNGGSFAPVLALRGLYPTVRKLAALDPHHSAEDLARSVFRTLPSLHELLPAVSSWPGPDLFDSTHWPDDALRPAPELLAAARAVGSTLPSADERCLQVVGVRQDTITGLRRVEGGFEFEVSEDGDGTVPRAFALWPGARAWYAAEGHGALPNNGRVIAAVVDLLRNGETRRLARSARGVRSAVARTLSEPMLRRIAPHKLSVEQLSPDARRRLLEPVVSPEFHESAASGATVAPSDRSMARSTPPARGARLRVRIAVGDVARARADALAVAVFSNVDPAGAARAIDARFDARIERAARERRLPGRLGQVTRLPASDVEHAPRHLLCVGLGEFDRLDADAVREAARALLLRAQRLGVAHLACVPFGAGSGLRAATALEAQLRGFAEARFDAPVTARPLRVTVLEFDPRKAALIVRALPAIQARLGTAALAIASPKARPAVATAATGRHRAESTVDPVYLLANTTSLAAGKLELRVSLLTAGAKAAILSGTRRVRIADLQAVLRALERGAGGLRSVRTQGLRLARLLLPDNVREGLARHARRPVAVVHDREAARVPWECLAVGGGFPALGAGLSRRYAGDGLSAARAEAVGQADRPLPVLVATDPTGDLPGATLEREALQVLLHEPQVSAKWLAGAAVTRQAVLAALRSGDFAALHFAGHAYFDAAHPERSGLVCARGQVLRGSDLAGIERLPALVFLNACEAARVRRGRTGRSRGEHAGDGGSIAEALLDGGVANYLGTFWPVGDSSALLFARELYAALLGGRSLGEAVLAARRAVHERGSADWANYLHYGSPDLVLWPA